ncbi:hypothetical protein [Psychroflexus montanilacus]|uniref:hypothetical protein n=1 Tax=Psychroflexus montanilacus TaxID=2873598 RepID=UPI001CCF41CC|nr:hypothetical protein [Psychroflexus montanilacus]MBZ9652823.1 hypothetical protein [Psychroflexus montanilacus]
MTRVKAFKTQKVFSKLMIGFGVLFLLVGIFAIVKLFIGKSGTESSSVDWTGFLQGFQGLFFIVLGTYNLRNEKYYIEWDEQQLRFFLPQTKQLEVIHFEDIQTIQVKLFEIQLQLKDKNYTLDLNTMEDEALKQVKAKFKDLQQNQNRNNSLDVA